MGNFFKIFIKIFTFGLFVHVVPTLASPWSSEPETVAGIRFGVPLEDAGMLQCIGSPKSPDIPCYVPMGFEFVIGAYQIIETSSTNARFIIGVRPFDYVFMVSEVLYNGKYEEIRSEIIAKYGPPTIRSIIVRDWGNRPEAFERLSWKGDRLDLTLDEVEGARAEFRYKLRGDEQIADVKSTRQKYPISDEERSANAAILKKAREEYGKSVMRYMLQTNYPKLFGSQPKTSEPSANK